MQRALASCERDYRSAFKTEVHKLCCLHFTGWEFSTKKIKMGLTFAGPHIWAQVVFIVRVDHHTFGFASGIVDADSLMILFDIT